MNTGFIGRKKEIEDLKKLLEKKSASLVVIKGRRRIGKSRLAQELSRVFTQHYVFAGLAPTKKINNQDQKKEFLRQMKRQGIRSFGDDDWGNLFEDVAASCSTGKILVHFDEISWMGQYDETFLPKLKNAWDLAFKINPKLMLILSGSNATWIDKNILTDTGFVGRISYRLTLDELALIDCNKFWGKWEINISAFEKLKVLSITGGIPRYLEEIISNESADSNILRLCFKKEGLLFHEFNDIFSDALSTKSKYYRPILEALAEQKLSLPNLAHAIGKKRSSGDLCFLLDDLCNAGFITMDYSWNLENLKKSKIALFRLSDNYIRFYLKFIAPNKEKILANTMHALPSGWDSIIGLQLENLILSKNNRLKIYDILNIPVNSIIQANPYFQTQTLIKLSCQIDFLIQTKEGSLYVCEIKFSKNKIQKNVISQVKEKILRLKKKKYMSCRPVLIHVNGVCESVIRSDFFVKIIDFGDFLKFFPPTF